MKRLTLLAMACLVVLTASGCLLTRVVTAPMRVVGGAATLIPVAGDAAHIAIDEAADLIDEVPL